MTLNIDEEVSRLEAATVAQLKARYDEVFGEPSPVTKNKAWLVKRIAWRLQALAEGDLSQRARRRAAELAQDVALRILPPRRASSGCFTAKKGGNRDDERLPPPGTILNRTYKGRTLQVKVLLHGFDFEGRSFSSLSAVAKEITGSHCSGLRFFGLAKDGGQA